MFSVKEKQHIANEIEKLLLSLNHPEMPKEKPDFHLRVDGEQGWSWANIKPNWTYGIKNPPSINPFNEVSRDLTREGENND